MTRGGRQKDRSESERRCLATGESQPKEGLIRFVLAPDGALTPDLAEKLPGRGVWVAARREAIALACKKRLFSRGFKTQVAVPEGLADELETLLARRAVESLSLARKAGQAVAGFEKTREALWKAAALLQASDGAPDGKQKLRRAAVDEEGEPLPCDETLSRSELGLAFGRDYVIHVALMKGGAAARVLRDCARLRGFRAESSNSDRRPALDETQPTGDESPAPSGPPAPGDGRQAR